MEIARASGRDLGVDLTLCVDAKTVFIWTDSGECGRSLANLSKESRECGVSSALGYPGPEICSRLDIT